MIEDVSFESKFVEGVEVTAELIPEVIMPEVVNHGYWWQLEKSLDLSLTDAELAKSKGDCPGGPEMKV